MLALDCMDCVLAEEAMLEEPAMMHGGFAGRAGNLDWTEKVKYVNI